MRKLLLVLGLAALLTVGGAGGMAFAATTYEQWEAETMTFTSGVVNTGVSLRYDADGATATKVDGGDARADTVVITARRNGVAGDQVCARLVLDGVAQPSSTDQCFSPGQTSYAERSYTGLNLQDGTDVAIRGVGISGDEALFLDKVRVEGPDQVTCDVQVTPGNNRLEGAVNGAAAGSVVCARGGVYTETDKLHRFTKGVTFKSYPGEQAEIRGTLRATTTANGFVLGDVNNQGDGVLLDGSYGNPEPHNWTGADNIATDGVHWDSDGGGLFYNEITNRHPTDTDRAGICVLMSGGEDPRNVSIVGNHIHDCGQLPRTNREHGIYASGMIGGVIQDNVVEDIADRGIQLYSHPVGVDVSGNIVRDGHHAGFVFDAQAQDNNVHNNVVAFNDEYSVYRGNTSTGGGNRFDNNCVWKANGTSGISTGNNYTATGNVTANPQFTGSGRATVVTNPTCAAKLPADSPYRP